MLARPANSVLKNVLDLPIQMATDAIELKRRPTASDAKKSVLKKKWKILAK